MSYDGKRLSKEDRKKHKAFKRNRGRNKSEEDYFGSAYDTSMAQVEHRTGKKPRPKQE